MQGAARSLTRGTLVRCPRPSLIPSGNRARYSRDHTTVRTPCTLARASTDHATAEKQPVEVAALDEAVVRPISAEPTALEPETGYVKREVDISNVSCAYVRRQLVFHQQLNLP